MYIFTVLSVFGWRELKQLRLSHTSCKTFYLSSVPIQYELAIDTQSGLHWNAGCKLRVWMRVSGCGCIFIANEFGGICIKKVMSGEYILTDSYLNIGTVCTGSTNVVQVISLCAWTLIGIYMVHIFHDVLCLQRVHCSYCNLIHVKQLYWMN